MYEYLQNYLNANIKRFSALVNKKFLINSKSLKDNSSTENDCESVVIHYMTALLNLSGGA